MKARERQQKRKQQRESMVRRSTPERQITPQGASTRPSVKLPDMRILFIPGAVLVLALVVFGLGLLNPLEIETNVNAIWLDQSWTYDSPSDEELAELVLELQAGRVGTVFAYVSSLKADNSWSGIVEQRNLFTEVDPLVRAFVQRLRQAYPDVMLYGWVEVHATTPDGYRLDSLQVQRTVSEFSRRVIDNLGFDGVFLDVKPIFEDNEDLTTLLRGVRSSLGLDQMIAVALSADLTPTDTDLNLAPQIAPGTVLSSEFKQRIAIQADHIVVRAYNSYLENPVDYINWVQYQTVEYIGTLTGIESRSRLFISVPNYADDLPAHRSSVESLSGALDGVLRGVNSFETTPTRLQGVAIYTDRPLSSEEWRIYRDKWLR